MHSCSSVRKDSFLEKNTMQSRKVYFSDMARYELMIRGAATLLKSGSYDGKIHASRAVREMVPRVHLGKIAK